MGVNFYGGEVMKRIAVFIGVLGIVFYLFSLGG
jgi:hypothetical protein